MLPNFSFGQAMSTFSGQNMGAGKLDRVAGDFLPLGVQIEDPRAADRAAVRLGVIAAVFDVVVFAVAVRAHREAAHRGPRPVIGQILAARKTRAAVGAVDEGIAIAPVGGIEQLAAAVVADTDIRGDEGVSQLLGAAFPDLKALKMLQLRTVARLDALDERQLRRARRNIRHEARKLFSLALQLQLHAGGGVLDETAEPVLAHQLMDKGPEADALDDPVYVDFCSFHDSPAPFPTEPSRLRQKSDNNTVIILPHLPPIIKSYSLLFP